MDFTQAHCTVVFESLCVFMSALHVHYLNNALAFDLYCRFFVYSDVAASTNALPTDWERGLEIFVQSFVFSGYTKRLEDTSCRA